MEEYEPMHATRFVEITDGNETIREEKYRRHLIHFFGIPGAKKLYWRKNDYPVEIVKDNDKKILKFSFDYKSGTIKGISYWHLRYHLIWIFALIAFLTFGILYLLIRNDFGIIIIVLGYHIAPLAPIGGVFFWFLRVYSEVIEAKFDKINNQFTIIIWKPLKTMEVEFNLTDIERIEGKRSRRGNPEIALKLISHETIVLYETSNEDEIVSYLKELAQFIEIEIDSYFYIPKRK